MTSEKSGRERASRLQKPASVEAVFMPSEGRQTICISPQLCCVLSGSFGVTAQRRLIPHLTAAKIPQQVMMQLEEARRDTRSETNEVRPPAKPPQVPPAATEIGPAPPFEAYGKQTN